jgi:putative ABC transport system permease protein
MFDIFRMTWRNFCRKKLRSILTIAGIGVGTLLITLVSCLGDTGKAVMSKELRDMGLDGISVSADVKEALDPSALKEIRKMPKVTAAVPLSVFIGTAQIGKFNGEIAACGIDAGADQVISLTPLWGKMLSRGDVSGGNAVCVVDEALALDAYGRTNVVGKTMQVFIGDKQETFEIIGVSKAGSSILQNVSGYIPDMVYIPYTAFEQLTGSSCFDQIAVRFTEDTDVVQAQEQLQKILSRHDTTDATFVLQDLASQRDRLSGLMDVVSLILQIISGVSLLVAGISIMTIMLVSVHERKGEIGIKKAIGATGGRILLEFMIEAALLTLLGSGAGILLAVVSCVIGGILVGVSVKISFMTIVVVLIFSLLLGIVFGVYPAKKAAALQPTEALRGTV